MEIDFSKLTPLKEAAAGHVQQAYVAGYLGGRAKIRDEILAIVKGTLDRDPTLQKLVQQLEEMK